MDDFVTLTQLIEKDKVLIQALTQAIKEHGIYTFDQVDLPCKADKDDLQIVSDLLVQQYQYEKDFEAYLKCTGTPLSPLERCQELPRNAEEAEDWANPYDWFGWPESELPSFEILGQSQTLPNTTSGTKNQGTCQVVSAAKIRQFFPVFSDADVNIDWWKVKMRNAKDNCLVECRVGEGMKGPGGSLWRPDLVAGWLVDRHNKGREGVSADKVGAMLKRFQGCEEIADTYYSPDLE
jgi:hypothetical protein